MNILSDDYDLIASSTYFQPLKKKTSATYCSKEEGAAPSQIDYVVASRRWKSNVAGCKVDRNLSTDRWGRNLTMVRW